MYLSILIDGGLDGCIPLVMMMSPLFFDLASRFKDSFNICCPHLAWCACLQKLSLVELLNILDVLSCLQN